MPLSHMKFIHDHHKSINKIAIASDSGLLSAMPSIATHFVKAQVRNFAVADIEQAKEWAATKEPRSGRFIILDGYADDVIALLVRRRIFGIFSRRSVGRCPIWHFAYGGFFKNGKYSA